MCYIKEGYLKDSRVFYCPLDNYRTPLPGKYQLDYSYYTNPPAPTDNFYINNAYVDTVSSMIMTSYDFNPIQTSLATKIQGTRCTGDYGNGTYPFDGMNPNNALLALDILQSKLDTPDTTSTGFHPDGFESHPGVWNCLRFDGSVTRVRSDSLTNTNSILWRQNRYTVLGNTLVDPSFTNSNSWSEYEYELKMLMNFNSK
jgi:hypothetical protein